MTKRLYHPQKRPPGTRECLHCRALFTSRWPTKQYCRHQCRAEASRIRLAQEAARNLEPPPMSAAAVAAFLDRSVELECAPAWLRHPVPWDARDLRGSL